MQTIVRVGGIVGGISALMLIALGARFGLIVAPALLVVGLAAGLASAKWLEWSWYGRQHVASLRGGMLAVGAAAVGALLGLLVLGARSTNALVQRSRLPGIDMTPLAHALAPLGWVGASVVAVLCGALLAIALSCTVGTLAALSKSKKAVQIVTRAQQLAQAVSASEIAQPVAVPARAAWTTGTLGMPQYSVYSGTLSSFGPAPVFGAAPTSLPKLGPAPAPLSPAEAPAPDAPLPGSRTPSEVRPISSQVNEQVAEALAAWGQQTQAQSPEPSVAHSPEHPHPTSADDAAETAPREQAASTFLNSGRAKPRRPRKKQNTRDWLC